MANTPNPIIVDLSHWQDDISFEEMLTNGTIGVIHKATEGTSYEDPMYAPRRLDAEAAGMLWSSYHFMRHGAVEEQIHNYLSVVQPTDGERICLDFEPVEGDEDPTLDDLHEAVQILQREVPECNIAIYSGHLIKELLGSSYDPLLETCSLWIAHYTEAEEPTWPTGTWITWDLWQYSDVEFVSGVSTPCDANRFNGSKDEAEAWFTGKQAKPDKDKPVVVIDIYVPEGVKVQVNIDKAKA